MVKKKIIVSSTVTALFMGAIGGFIYHHKVPDTHTPHIHTEHIASSRAYNVSHIINHPKNSSYKIGKTMHVKHKSKKRFPVPRTAKSALVMDAYTGKILYKKNADQPLKVASIAKLMTLFLVEQKVARTKNGWNETVSGANSPELREMGESSTVGGFKFEKGHHYTVRQLFKAALIESSNNAAIALGQWVAGNNVRFIEMMNEQAKAWHIKAHFVSASGLENDDLKKFKLNTTKSMNGANQLSAKAVAIISQHLLKKYPSVLKESKLTDPKVDSQTLNNMDELLPGKAFAKKGMKVDGLKTGFTPAAGYCYVGTEKPDAMRHRIIVVVLHDSKEFPDARNLMQYFYRRTKLLNIKN